MGDKKFVGNGKIKTFDNGGFVINIRVRVADLTPNEKGYCNITVATRREPDKYGNTHTVYLNDFVPVKRENGPAKEVKEEPDLPF